MFYWGKRLIGSICSTLIGCSRQLVRAFKEEPRFDGVYDDLTLDAEDRQRGINTHKWRHWGPISAAIVTAMIGLTTSMLHVSWWQITTLGGSADFLLFLTWNYLVFRNLNDSSQLGGGFIKIGWCPVDSKDWALLKYCHRCMCYKVPRAHHCSKCGRCVLLMDHHCPWINGCVGRRNQFKFIRFLSFAILGCLHAAIIITSCLYEVVIFILYAPVRYMSENGPRPHAHPHLSYPQLPINSISLFIFSVLAVGMAYGVILAVGILLFMQLRSLHLDQTGIEKMFPRKEAEEDEEEEDDEEEEEEEVQKKL